MTTEKHSQTIADHEDTQAAAPQTRQLNVLVVDDDPDVSSMLEVLLSNSGYRVVCARSVFMALEALAEEAFPIVIIDRGLEDGDGIRLCKEIRQSSSPGYVYIILLTARDSREDVVAGLQAGADDYLSKKVSESELIARLNTASRIVRLERSLRESISERTKVTTTDVLTGGHNRRHFVKQIGRDLERALQTKRELSILVIDIDFFKTVNDRHGHVAGDELLRQLANRVRFALPHDEDWIARIGGEEFVVALPGTSLANAVALGDRLRGAVHATPFHVSGVDVSITISMGAASLATLPKDEEATAQALLDQADQYLYRSKLAGRDRVSAPPQTKQ
ncbi:MAG TPA: diguanylate cyclase [Steroidobacteraceae bacterium]|nr:diguanylate cyclase [Steroidobacteraceae bacterium]